MRTASLTKESKVGFYLSFKGQATEHTTVEIWSNDFSLDPMQLLLIIIVGPYRNSAFVYNFLKWVSNSRFHDCFNMLELIFI